MSKVEAGLIARLADIIRECTAHPENVDWVVPDIVLRHGNALLAEADARGTPNAELKIFLKTFARIVAQRKLEAIRKEVTLMIEDIFQATAQPDLAWAQLEVCTTVSAKYIIATVSGELGDWQELAQIVTGLYDRIKQRLGHAED